MRLETQSMRTHGVPRLLVLVAAVGTTLWSCSNPRTRDRDDDLYTHGRIHVDTATRARWNAGEESAKVTGDKLVPIPVDRQDSATIPLQPKDTAKLHALKGSERHGANDKRLLSIVGKNSTPQSSGIVAEVTLVMGSEYKGDIDFRRGWIPLAIVALPPRSAADTVVYPKLKLHGDTSWVFVRERADKTWSGSLVRIDNGKIRQDSLYVEAVGDDKLEPVIGARFKWEAKDESIWAYCGGKCCKIVASKPL
jgi:hypothetical protein